MKRVFLAVALAACGGVNEEKMDAKVADAPKQIDAAPDALTRRCDPAKPFDAPVAIDELNTPSNDYWPVLSADELTIYFFTNRGGVGSSGGYDIFVATRSSLTGTFGPAAPLAGVNSTLDEECPSITADGLFMYFDRRDNTTLWDIWVSQRANTTVDFGVPQSVGSLNQPGAVNDDNQFILPDNSAMYLLSNRTTSTTYDIYRAARNVGGTFDAAVDVLPTTDDESSVGVTADELTMYFTTNKAPSLGAFDVWMTKRTTTADGWGMPSRVDVLSSAASETIGWLSADGCDIYITKDVGQGQDIFWARKPM
jgi:hypothetical protein